MKQIVITLSEANENTDIDSLEALMWFIVNELENANIGAYYAIEDGGNNPKLDSGIRRSV